jgi:hypothetical protein
MCKMGRCECKHAAASGPLNELCTTYVGFLASEGGHLIT